MEVGMKKKQIVIVGAGISGLYLALLLQESYEVKILEARSRIGGRIHSIKGHDMGPSWIWAHQKNALELCNTLGIKLFAQYTQGYALYDTQEKLEIFMPPPSQSSARVDGSLSFLIQKLKERLGSCEIILNTQVTQIQLIQEQTLIHTRSKEYMADYTILTPPPRLSAKLDFTPELPSKLLTKMQNTQTWMGNSAKCVIEFKKAFWREKSLSGFVFSHLGPLGEIHDACTKDKAALFGFVNLHADMSSLEEDVKKQIKRVFDIDESEITAIYVVDWKNETFSSVSEDSQGLRAHPSYGIDTQEYSNKILFSSTEFSYEEGGYIEGAIVQAKKIASYLL